MSISEFNRNRAFDEVPITKRQQEVLSTLTELGKASLDSVCNKLGKPKNELSGRITELKEEKFLIKEIESEKSSCSNNAVTVYMRMSPDERIEKLNARFAQLRDLHDSLINDLNLNIKTLSKHSEMVLRNKIMETAGKLRKLEKNNFKK